MLDVALERVENHESLDRQCGPEFHSKLFLNHPINSNEKKKKRKHSTMENFQMECTQLGSELCTVGVCDVVSFNFGNVAGKSKQNL